MSSIGAPLTPSRLCPPRTLLAAKALGPASVVVAAAHSETALQSVVWGIEFGIVTPILVGDLDRIRALAQAHGWDLSAARLIAAASDQEAAELAVGLARAGEARVLMKGHLHTDVLMRAVLDPAQGLRQARRLTHAFHLTWPGAARDLLISDAAINVAPDQETRRHIVRHAVALARALGPDLPRVALLSATEEVNAAMPSSLAAAAFIEAYGAEARGWGCEIAGPLALDVALSEEAARIKGLVDHPVAGRANVLIVPNIETGNALFKALVHLLHATAAGLVLGARVPIVLTSRADPAEARLSSLALARILAGAPPVDG